MKQSTKKRGIFYLVFGVIVAVIVTICLVAIFLPSDEDNAYIKIKGALENQVRVWGYEFNSEIVTVYADESRDIVTYQVTEDFDFVSGYREVKFLRVESHKTAEGNVTEVSREEYSTRVAKYLQEYWYLVSYTDGTPDTKMSIDDEFAKDNTPTKTADLEIGDFRYSMFMAKEFLTDFTSAKNYGEAKGEVEEFNKASAAQRELSVKTLDGELFEMTMTERETGENYVLYTVYANNKLVEKIGCEKCIENPDGSKTLSYFSMKIKNNPKSFNHALLLPELDNYVLISSLITL